jgi:hypothetical protein
VTYPTGWIQDERAVEESCLALEKSGHPVLFGSAYPELKGFASAQRSRGHHGVFLFEAERKLYGKFLAAYHQRRGTCVGQGTAKALNNAWYNAIVLLGEIGRVVEFAVAPIYGAARVEIGKRRIVGDGAVGAWAAQAVHEGYAVPEAVYQKYDLRGDDETYAVQFGDSGVPAVVKEGGKDIRFVCHRLKSAEEIADAIFARSGVAFCTSQLYGSVRGKDGVALVSGTTAHCESMCAAYYSKGNLIIGVERSWGDAYQSGPTTIEYDGGPQEVPKRFYGARAEDVDRGLRSGRDEAWCFRIVTGKGIR